MSNTRANTKILPIQSQIINWFIPARERYYFVTISKLSIPTILLFFQNNGYGPRVQDECHEEYGEGQPKVDGVWNLIIRIIFVLSQLIGDVLWMVPTPYRLPQNNVLEHGYWFHLKVVIVCWKDTETDKRTWLTSAVWTGKMERLAVARTISPRADVGKIILPGMPVSNWGREGLSDLMNQQICTHTIREIW